MGNMTKIVPGSQSGENFYPGNAGTNTALLELIKVMLNSVILRKGARILTINIKKNLP
jgi:hypothetical protein